MSGALVAQHRVTLEQLLPREEIATGLAQLPAEQRDEFIGASTMSWVQIRTLEAAFRAIGRATGRDPVDLQLQVVKHSVAHNMRTIWRLFLRFTDDAGLVSRLPRVYARAFDGGRVTVLSVSGGRADFQVDGWSDMPDYARRGLAAGTEAIMGLAGRQAVQVTATFGASEPRFAVRWRR